jgi:hypothetical protein
MVRVSPPCVSRSLIRNQGVPSASELQDTVAGDLTVTCTGGGPGGAATVTGGTACSARGPAEGTAVR